MLQDETSHEEQAQRGLRIGYYPALHQLERLGQWLWHYFDELVRLAGVLVVREI